ncbi:hypothetical protein HZS_6164, partial [Henneguya salminicola]
MLTSLDSTKTCEENSETVIKNKKRPSCYTAGHCIFEPKSKAFGNATPTEIIANSSQSGSDNDTPAKNVTPSSSKRKTLDEESRRALTKVLGKLNIGDDLRQSILSLAEKQPKGDNFSDYESFESDSSLEDTDTYKTQNSYKPTVQPYFKDYQSSSSAPSSVESYFIGDITKTGPVSDEEVARLRSNKSVNQSSLIASESSPTPEMVIPDKERSKSVEEFCENIRHSFNDDIISCMNDSTYDYLYFIAMMEDTYPDKTKIKQLRSNFGHKFILLRDQSSIRQMFTSVLSRVQNQINTSQTIPKLKICILGHDDCITLFLQCLVEFNMHSLSAILDNTQFLLAPIGIGKLSAFLSHANSLYSSFFNNDEWISCCNSPPSIMTTKISSFIHGNTITYSLPISEATLKMINISNADDSSSLQITVPFIMEVAVGFINIDLKTYPDFIENCFSFPMIMSKNTTISREPKKLKRISFLQPRQSPNCDDSRLLIDYWIVTPELNVKENDKIVKSDKKEIKLSNKKDFEIATIFRTKMANDTIIKSESSEYLHMIVQKSNTPDQIFKPKKNKDKPLKININNINHLVCATKKQSFNVEIDGRIWE